MARKTVGSLARLRQALQRVHPGRLAETLVRAATAEAAARNRLQRDLVSLIIPSLFLLPLILPLPFPLIICTGKGSVIIQYIGYGLAGHLILGPKMRPNYPLNCCGYQATFLGSNKQSWWLNGGASLSHSFHPSPKCAGRVRHSLLMKSHRGGA